MYGSGGGAGYVIPRYRAPADAAWYHVLHGNIPGHQIDFMYCPEVPQGPLTTTHFSHLARLMKYIEPQTGATHAFAIGNLSRDDTQHEPGHGAVGLICGFRIGGAMDHAGRGNPPFAHGIVAVDRDLGYTSLLEASATFYRHVMNATEVNSSAGMFYREYVSAVRERPDRVSDVLERYIDEFRDLPYLRRSSATWEWLADEAAQPKRVVIVHKHDEPFGAIAHAAAKIATVLYRSNIKWTSITSGREADIPGGVSVRFVRERDVTMEDRHGMLLKIEDLAEDEGEIARGVFGARPRSEEEEKPRFGGWRERFAAQQGGAALLSQTFGGGGVGGGGAGVGAAGAVGAAGGVGAAGAVGVAGAVGAAGGGVPAVLPEWGRAPVPSPPSPRGAGRGEAHAPGMAGGARQEAGPGAAGLSAAAAGHQVGPKGTLVIDAEKLLRGAVRGEALPEGIEAGSPAAARRGPEPPAAAVVPSRPPPAGAVGGAAWSAPAPAAPFPAAPASSGPASGGGEDRDEIPVIVERPASSRTWIWAVAGLSLAAVAGVAAVLVSQRVPAAGPAVPEATGAGVTLPPATAAPGPSTTPGPSAAAPAAATVETGSPSATAEPSAQPETTAKPAAERPKSQPKQSEPESKPQAQQGETGSKPKASGRNRSTPAGGAPSERFKPKPGGGKVPPPSTSEPPLPEGKPDF
ncbi:hypothetical protein SOCEGT47_014750 [Sorangium cellulosum]|uniref:Uncharacterized protein n=1 Tax=Sorangium cellulosum TaxID=56 RepID=A0A4P2PW62_SORCE|nr:hypothetical protein [Sorangium cellulosum]AUX20997.1 hypothetical protein SOCEGT47_014750 [Sorangium cellulosum]